MTVGQLAVWLRAPVSTVRQTARHLVRLGIATKTSDGLVLAPGDLVPVLDQVARLVRTNGRQAQQAKKYHDEADKRRRELEDWQEQVATAGTSHWWKEETKASLAMLNCHPALVEEATRSGLSRQALVEDMLNTYLAHRAQQGLLLPMTDGRLTPVATPS